MRISETDAAVRIQKCFRHFLNGRKIRNQMKYEMPYFFQSH